MTPAAAFTLAKAHGIEIALDSRGVLVMRSYGPIPPDVRSALKSAKADLVAALRQSTVGNPTVEKRVGLEVLRARGFEIKWRGDHGGTVPPLSEVVEKRQAFFRRLLAWKAPL